MRVPEKRVAGPFPMGKRKHKLHKKGKSNGMQNSDSSDEGTSGGKCPHISKALNFTAVKKALKQHGSVGDCKDCEGEKSSSKPGSPILGVAGGDEASDPAFNSIWLCMQCGNQGCGRNTRHRHALQHYKTPRSSSHALVLNLSAWCLWCYDCDDEVMIDGNKKLVESVEFVRKMAGAVSSGPMSKSLIRLDSKEADVDVEGGIKDETRSLLQRSDSTNRPKPPNAALPKVKGLSNLGNTCFFNAVMQNLCQTPVLESVLSDGVKTSSLHLPGIVRSISSDSDDDDMEEPADGEQEHKMPDLVPLSTHLGDRVSGLTTSLLSFLKDMHNPSKNSVISPATVFQQVCRKAPRFKGFQQQDSHELLRHLMDGMKTEEIQRARSAILKKFDINESSKNAKLDDDLKMKVKEYGRQAKHTFVDDVFGGYFISTVLCEECQVPSQMLEPFLDISLPIMEEKTIRPSNILSYRGSASKKDVAATKSMSSLSSAPLALEEDDLDEAAAAGGGTSKHMSKKMKKQARKAAKRKGATTLQAHTENQTTNSEEKDCNGLKTNGTENTAENSDEDMSDADIEDNIESDVSRSKLQRSESATESIDSASNRKLDGSPEGSASNNEFSVTSEDTTLVEDSSSTINGDVRTRSPDSHSGKVGDDVNTKLADSVGGLKLADGETTDDSKVNHQSHHSSNNPHALCNGNGGSTSSSTSSAMTEACRQKRRAARNDMCRRGATCTLGPRYQPVSHECSVQSCLHQFTSAELLTGNNKFGCQNCSRNKHANNNKDGKREMVYCNASKQLLIFSPPLVLTLHLKRFSQVGFSLRKVSRKVEFPSVLDLAPYCSELCQGVNSNQTKILYSLYGIVEHSGRLTGGHYTAYVKVRSKTDQSHVSKFLQHGCRIQGRKLHKILQELDRQRKLSSTSSCPSQSQRPSTPQDDPDDPDSSPPPPPSGRWFYISDSKVSEVASENNIFNREAYLLFYERLY